jgi:amino acid exporter
VSGEFVGLLTGLGVFAVGMISPGPNILSIVALAMGQGRAPALALALGIASGSFIWGVLTVFGLTALIFLYASVMTALKLLGAAYLLWLGLKAFQRARDPSLPVIARPVMGMSARAAFGRGLMIQLTNPKAAMTWAAVAALGVAPGAAVSTAAALVAGAGVLSVVGHSAYALLFSTERAGVFYRRGKPLIETSVGLFLTVASYKLLTARL